VTAHPARVGDVVSLADHDYYCGVGPLRLCITEIVAPHPRYPNATWTFAKGIELRCDGEEVGERHVLVRLSALRTQERP
jgi:hypothetical protein